MNRRFADEALALSHSQKELLSKNQNKTMHTVFMSQFYCNFYTVTYKEQKGMISLAGIATDSDYKIDEEDSIHSNQTVTRTKTIYLCEIMWRRQSPNQIIVWKNRADIVNQLPIVGHFHTLLETLRDNTNDHILQLLTLEYDRIVKYLQNGVKKSQAFTESVKEKRFRKERFALGSQIFHSFF